MRAKNSHRSNHKSNRRFVWSAITSGKHWLEPIFTKVLFAQSTAFIFFFFLRTCVHKTDEFDSKLYYYLNKIKMFVWVLRFTTRSSPETRSARNRRHPNGVFYRSKPHRTAPFRTAPHRSAPQRNARNRRYELFNIIISVVAHADGVGRLFEQEIRLTSTHTF